MLPSSFFFRVFATAVVLGVAIHLATTVIGLGVWENVLLFLPTVIGFISLVAGIIAKIWETNRPYSN